METNLRDRMPGNPRRVVLISGSCGALLTALLFYFAQILHQPWAERIAAPFALAGFAVNVHQGNLAVTLLLMFVVFSFITWFIVEGIRLERRRRLQEER
jgi:hypothetical protein